MLSSFQNTGYHCGQGGCKISVRLSHISLCWFGCIWFLWSNRNPSIVLTCKCEEDSTTNLIRHVKSCKGQVVDDSNSIVNYAQGSTYNKAELWYLISRWVFECHRPFAIINNEPLQCIFKMLHVKVEMPSETMILWDVKEIHGISKVHVRKYFQVSHNIFVPQLVDSSKNYPGQIHLGFDGWTSLNVISFLRVVIHTACEGLLQSFLLDFIT